MLQFKNRFIDQLLEKYKYGLKFEENSEKRNNILLNVEEILKKYLEIFRFKSIYYNFSLIMGLIYSRKK